MLKRYLAKANIRADEDNFIFRSVNYFRSGGQYKLKRTMKPLSYSRTREIVLEGLKKIGLNPKQFGLHSLRAGGATSAANNSVLYRLFKRHGRWRSENAKDGYVKDDLRSLLSVSLSIGI